MPNHTLYTLHTHCTHRAETWQRWKNDPGNTNQLRIHLRVGLAISVISFRSPSLVSALCASETAPSSANIRTLQKCMRSPRDHRQGIQRTRPLLQPSLAPGSSRGSGDQLGPSDIRDSETLSSPTLTNALTNSSPGRRIRATATSRQAWHVTISLSISRQLAGSTVTAHLNLPSPNNYRDVLRTNDKYRLRPTTKIFTKPHLSAASYAQCHRHHCDNVGSLPTLRPSSPPPPHPQRPSLPLRRAASDSAIASEHDDAAKTQLAGLALLATLARKPPVHVSA